MTSAHGAAITGKLSKETTFAKSIMLCGCVCGVNHGSDRFSTVPSQLRGALKRSLLHRRSIHGF